MTEKSEVIQIPAKDGKYIYTRMRYQESLMVEGDLM